MTKGTKRDLEIIAKVQAIRSRNNVAWMSLVRLALTSAPRKARALLAEITENDAEINAAMQDLTREAK